MSNEPQPPKLSIVPLLQAPQPMRGIEVVVDPDEARITAEAILAIAKRADVYQRGGKIVEPRFVAVPAASKIEKTDSWQITEAKTARVRSLAAETCHFTKINKKGKVVDANVPDYLASAVLAARDWPFPVLTGIAEAPTMRPDGTLITEQGYDAATGIYLATTLRVDVPERPTREQAIVALSTLLDVICDFPLSTDAGRSVWLSGVLSAAVRPVIDGPVPMHIIEASMRGSGKSKLVDAASLITAGRSASRMIYVDNDNEMDKRITSLALAGDASVLIDNIVDQFGCPSLDAAITSTLYRGRVLGRSEMTPHMPMNIVWWATGNGMTIGADMARRSLLGRLEPRCEHPETREGPEPGVPWRHPRLLNFIIENRGRLLSAALTAVRAYITADCPDQFLPPMDFDAWSRIVRSTLVWAGLADPGNTIADVRAADVRADALATFVERWPVGINTAVTARELLDAAGSLSMGDGPINGTPRLDVTAQRLWKDAIVEWCPPKQGEGEIPSVRTFSMALRSAKGVIVGNHKIDAGVKQKTGIPWIKISIDPNAAEPTTPPPTPTLTAPGAAPREARSLFDTLDPHSL